MGRTVGRESVGLRESQRRRETALATVVAAGPGCVAAHGLLTCADIPDEAPPLGGLTREQRIVVAAELAKLRRDVGVVRGGNPPAASRRADRFAPVTRRSRWKKLS